MNSNTNSNDKKKKKQKKESNIGHDFVKITGAVPCLLWFRHKAYYIGENGVHKRQGICSNHISLMDPVLIHCLFWDRRVYFLAAVELYADDLKSFFFKMVKCIPVDRNNFSMASFSAVTERLKAGKTVAMFPEGRINKDDHDMLSFKTGAVLMAASSNVPIVPVYIVKRDKWYKRQIALIGDPIDLAAMYGTRPSMQNVRDASVYLRNKEIELMNYYENHIAKRDKNK